MSSIFRAGKFGRYVVTRFLADPDFHGHRPAVLIYLHLFWGLMSAYFDALTTRLVHPTAPVLLTKNGPLGTIHSKVAALVKQARLLTHLEFESRSRTIRSRYLQSFALPNKTAFL